MATSTGYYLYGFTDCLKHRDDSIKTVTGDGKVQNIPYQGIGILCSPVNGKKLKPTRDNLLAHQKVLEAWLGHYSILPSRFGVVAQSKGALQRGVRANLPIVRSKLQQFRGKRELNIKAFWEKEFIYDHILDKHSDLKRFRNSVSKMKGGAAHHKSIEVGQLVERALLKEGEAEAEAIMVELSPGTLQTRKTKVFGELMFLNMAALVNDETEPQLDELVNKAATSRQGRVKFKYVGPSPPASFVDIHLKF